jgi:DNA-binding beta-propeller fold protein YncE
VVTLAGITNSGYLDGAGSVARFVSPAGLVADAGGNLYVADTGNNRVLKYTPGP